MTRFLKFRLYIADWLMWIVAWLVIIGDVFLRDVPNKPPRFPRWGFYHRRGEIEGPRK